VTGATEKLRAQGVTDILVKDVPGSYELPYAAKWMVVAHKLDAVICVGVLIKGATMHFECVL
jgi:6,7-dimethyl-8-ribityllumazine synthase